MYIVVGGVVRNGAEKFALVYEVSLDFEIVGVRQMVPLRMLGKYVVDRGLKPLNFSIDRVGGVVEDCGSFERFSRNGSVVILRVIRRKSSGELLGAQVLDCAGGKVLRLSKDKLFGYVESYRAKGEHFLQNGIYRDGVLNCYPGKSFMVLHVADRLVSERVQAPKVDVHTGSKVGVIFTRDQKREIARARGLRLSADDISYIENPELSPEQMKELVDGVLNFGAKIKYYAKPVYSVEAMKFYNGIVRSDKVAGLCSGLLSHPSLDVDLLYELYGFVLAGLDYRGFEGCTAEEARIALAESTLVDKEWGDMSFMSSLEILDSYGG